MSAPYPTPATPLPWHYGMTLVTADCDYVVHAANAFPHLVAALEAMVDRWEPDTEVLDRVMWESACSALAIARGEVTP